MSNPLLPLHNQLFLQFETKLTLEEQFIFFDHMTPEFAAVLVKMIPAMSEVVDCVLGKSISNPELLPLNAQVSEWRKSRANL
jgi:hypothetical protein